MGEVIKYKCTPHNWTTGGYLICLEDTVKTSKGNEYVFYMPIERWINDSTQMINTHKGCYFKKNEFYRIERFR